MCSIWRKKHVLVHFQSLNFLVFEMQKGISFPLLSSIMVLNDALLSSLGGPRPVIFNDVKNLSEEETNNAHLTVFVWNSYRRSCMKFGGLWRLYHCTTLKLSCCDSLHFRSGIWGVGFSPETKEKNISYHHKWILEQYHKLSTI